MASEPRRHKSIQLCADQVYDAATVSPRRKSSQKILEELEADYDGQPVRDIGVWTLEKLAILRLYFDAFTAASGKAGGGV